MLSRQIIVCVLRSTKDHFLVFAVYLLDEVDILYYSQVANRRGGTFINFSKFFRPPRSLIGSPRLLIFKKKSSDQDVFTIDLLYLQFFLSENAYLTPI